MLSKYMARLKKIKFKNLISIAIFLIYFFFSFIIFWSFYGTYIKVLKRKHIERTITAAEILDKFISEKKENLAKDAEVIASDRLLLESLKNNILIGKDWKISNNTFCVSLEKNDKNRYSKTANEYYKRLYGKENPNLKKKIEIFNKKGVLLSCSEDVNSKEDMENIIEDVMKNSEDTVSIIQKTDDNVFIRAFSKIKENNKQYGLVLISEEINNIFLKDLKMKLGNDIFISTHREIVFTTIEKYGRALEGQNINFFDFSKERGYNELNIAEKKYGMSFFPIKNDYNHTILFAGVATNLKDYEEKKDEIIIKFIIFQILFLVLIILLTYYTIGKVFIPFSKVLKNIKLLKEGKYKKTSPIEVNGELDGLEKDFNEMIKSVEERENALIRLNITLEEKVKTRTLELREKNKDLKKVVQKVEKINEKMNNEMEVAKKIHEKLVKFDERDFFGYKLYLKNISVGGIGGDFVEVIELKNKNKGIIFADVAGHGVAAALMVSALKFIVNVYLEDVYSPSEAIYLLNDLINKSFVTGITVSLVYMIIDKSGEKVTLSTAAQENVYLIKNKIVKKLMKSGIILGVLENEEIKADPVLDYKDKVITLEKGEKIFLYTDGLVENSIYNRETIEWELEKLKKSSGENFSKKLQDELKKSNKEKKDDITYLILEKSC